MSLWDWLLGRRAYQAEYPVQPGRGRTPRPQLILCPPPGTADWPAIVAAWPDLEHELDGLQCYHTQWMPSLTAYPANGDNLAARMIDLGVATLGTLVLEAPAFKEWSDDPEVYVAQITEAMDTIQDAGGLVTDVVFDEPVNAGRWICQPPRDLDVVASHVGLVMARLRGRDPTLTLWLCEPYPSLEVATIQRAVELISPDGLVLDLDYRACKQAGPLRDTQAALAACERLCRARHIPWGLILWGCEERTDAAFARSYRSLLGLVQHAVDTGRLGGWPDRLIVQSWSDSAALPKRVPAVLPVDAPDSLWSLLRLTRASL